MSVHTNLPGMLRSSTSLSWKRCWRTALQDCHQLATTETQHISWRVTMLSRSRPGWWSRLDIEHCHWRRVYSTTCAPYRGERCLHPCPQVPLSAACDRVGPQCPYVCGGGRVRGPSAQPQKVPVYVPTPTVLAPVPSPARVSVGAPTEDGVSGSIGSSSPQMLEEMWNDSCPTAACEMKPRQELQPESSPPGTTWWPSVSESRVEQTRQTPSETV